MITDAEIRQIERALAQLVYCDDCTWTGSIHECRSTNDGWLVCPLCQGRHIFEKPRTMH
jgi:hypothetical protein